MTIAATSAITTTNANTTKSALTQTAVDFDMFLKLLTTQMQNQDPLKPMDSTEYTQQLAQFSQVEQSVKQTSALTDILAQLGTQNMAQASGFIGRNAQFDFAVSGLTAETPATWNYNASAPVTSLTATIKDAAGRTVATETLDAKQTGDFTWNGELDDGTKATAGAYTLSIKGTDSKGDTVPVAINTSGTVSEVVGANGKVTLGVNGVQIPLDKLIRLAAQS